MATPSDNKELQGLADDKSDEFSLLNFEMERLKEESNHEFSFLTVGRTGAGKSTLLNALTASNEFKSCGDRGTAGTKFMSRYTFERNEVAITAWDSPGFEDCSGIEEEYKTELKKNCSDVDLVLFCLSLQDPRDHLREENSSLLQITDALSPEVWRKCLVVLTYGNVLEHRFRLDRQNVEEAFVERIREWKKKVQEGLEYANVHEEIIKKIQVVAAGHHRKKDLPGRPFWLSFLWIAMLSSINSERAKLAWQRANEDRLVLEKNSDTSSSTSIVVTKDYLAMAAGGGVGLTGVAIGGTTGALIGALAIGIPTFGVAAGVGLVLGMGIGGAIGGGAGTVVGMLIKEIRQKRRKKESTTISESESISDQGDSISDQRSIDEKP